MEHDSLLCSLILLQAIVFMVGGGNYIEYQNLMDYAKVNEHLLEYCTGNSSVLFDMSMEISRMYDCIEDNKLSLYLTSGQLEIFLLQRQGGAKKVVYGASEIVNASQFIRQVCSCTYAGASTVLMGR